MIESLILGSAKWGADVSKKTAFALLDKFVEAGGIYVDGAMNYPINSVVEDFGLANRYLSEWISLNPEVNLNVFVKLGSVNNFGGPEHDLSPKTINRNFELLQQIFGSSLGGVGVHWDNRGLDEVDQIKATIEEFDRFHHKGFRIGMSGVKEIKSYFELGPKLRDFWEIQVKETIDDHTIRENYAQFFSKASYLVYGINSGKKLTTCSVQGSFENDNENQKQESKADLYFFWIKKILESHQVKKVILGPRTVQQLDSILLRISNNVNSLSLVPFPKLTSRDSW